jgi:hypothetical protein
MKIDNHNEALTNVAMPERRIPVLVAGTSDIADGFVGGEPWSVNRVPWSVRRVSPDALAALSDPAQRKRVEQQYGRIDEASRSQLLELLALAERLQAGDWTPIKKSVPPSSRAQQKGDVSRFEITGKFSFETPVFALTKQFTKGLEKTQLVVWWAELPNKFAPGIYCENISTALFALALSAIGQPGGIGVCQHCGEAFPRTRARQRYCSARCRVNAGMRRYRAKLERKRKAKGAKSRSAHEPKSRSKGKRRS